MTGQDRAGQGMLLWCEAAETCIASHTRDFLVALRRIKRKMIGSSSRDGGSTVG